MSKKILLIDSDEAFAQSLSTAISGRGFTATLATDSERGMSLAKSESPDLIVVCVEAQPTNGYMLCTRLKKDDRLKDIPVILTSANATADAFEKHKKLKTRAEDYLIKPFEPKLMLEKASALLGVTAGGDDGEEEIVHVEDEPLALGDLVDGEDEPISLSDAEAAEARNGQPEEALVIEEVEEVPVQEDEAAGGDDDLDMFDRAFDSLGGPSQPPPATTARFGDLQLAPDPPPDAEEKQPTELSAPDDDAVLNSLVHEEEPVSISDATDEAEGSVDDRLAELQQSVARESKGKPDKDVGRLKDELKAKEKELRKAQQQQSSLESQLQELKDESEKRESAYKTLQQRAESLAAAAKKFERELALAREEAKKDGEAEELREKVDALEKELESARTEVTALTGEKDIVGEERDELKKQLKSALSSAELNEDRAVKAYARIKHEEKLREKAKKALQIALQLLDESSDADDSEEAEKRTA